MIFKTGDAAEVIGKEYTNSSYIHWPAEMDKTIGMVGTVRHATPNVVYLNIPGFDIPIYHPNDLRLIPPQTESMDKKEPKSMPTLWEAFIEDYADEIHNWSTRLLLEIFWHYNEDGSRAVAEFLTPKPPAQPKTEPEDRRKGGERRVGLGRRKFARGIMGHPAGTPFIEREHKRRSGKDRRKKTECNCSYPDYCNAGERIKRLESSAEKLTEQVKAWQAYKRLETDKHEAAALRVKELEANYVDSERRVDTYRDMIKDREKQISNYRTGETVRMKRCKMLSERIENAQKALDG